jgi:hypothetical protein
MSAVAAAPDELDAFAHAMRATADQQRTLVRRLETRLDALGPDRRALGPAADLGTRALRLVIAHSDVLALEAADAAEAFRSADLLLRRLLGPGRDTGSDTGGSRERGSLLPVPDVSVEWSWPPTWTIERRWDHGESFAEIAAGAGARAEAGAGLDVTRQAIRLGAFAETRLGAWVSAAVGTAIGPFAAQASGEVFAGALSRGDALLHVGRDGARAHLGGELFAGAKAEGDLRAGIGPIQAGAHGAVSYGLGLSGDADIDLSLERIGGRLELGGALGFGLEGGFEYYVEPAWVAEGLARLGDEAFSIGTSALDDGLTMADDALTMSADAIEVAGDVAAGADDLVGDVTHAGGSVLRSLGGMLG